MNFETFERTTATLFECNLVWHTSDSRTPIELYILLLYGISMRTPDVNVDEVIVEWRHFSA